MEHDVEALPISLSILAELAQKGTYMLCTYSVFCCVEFHFIETCCIVFYWVLLQDGSIPYQLMWRTWFYKYDNDRHIIQSSSPLLSALFRTFAQSLLQRFWFWFIYFHLMNWEIFPLNVNIDLELEFQINPNKPIQIQSFFRSCVCQGAALSRIRIPIVTSNVFRELDKYQQKTRSIRCCYWHTKSCGRNAEKTSRIGTFFRIH